jgi:hypothetical protein
LAVLVGGLAWVYDAPVSPRQRRSTRSHVIEIALTMTVVIGIWIFLLNGGPASVDQWLGPMFGPRS